MGRPLGSYSRFIAWLKILLPMAALALLSTMFLLSRGAKPGMDVPFADTLVGGETANQQISAPYYAGTTPRGDVLTMSARVARADGEGLIFADDLSAHMRLNSGGDLQLDAAAATVRDVTQQTQLDGGVRIQSSTGYVVTTDSLLSGLDRIEVETLGPVQGSGPAGTLEAGKLRIVPTEDGTDVQMLFTEGVKLLYQPPRQEKAAP
ncbi:hypothetical protein [Tropicibacter naphthalenivorans]|uniref:Lipopolysaccharide-assembly, LptC-related n=1 Tax=Tropicibacter naphthalenivorans TaxID=441103 RepID=A0A0N7M026_9RHOB|nr:hypothetical protein [Tropicibacter naphthalenivorans]CUH79289.1 hypothetical protein TRN7648_02394 [Tropicibacter naphthalenivorans]SMC71123.1 lipopolysaccharide export system protein LptC [Tropicibacter naphthalenivorans]